MAGHPAEGLVHVDDLAAQLIAGLPLRDQHRIVGVDHHRPQQPQVALSPLPLADVAGDAEHAHRSAQPEHQPRADFQRPQATVLSADGDFIGGLDFTAELAGDHLPDDFVRIPRQQVLQIELEHLLAAVAGQRMDGLVDGREFPIQIVRVDDIARVFNKLAIALLAAGGFGQRSQTGDSELRRQRV